MSNLCVQNNVFPTLSLAINNRRLAIFVDENTHSLYEQYAHYLSPYKPSVFSVPAGEGAKTRAVKAMLEDQLIKAGFGRDSLFLAFGGGVVCDLVGFLAGTFMRGVAVCYFPTTLLAMVDAAIGGKVAINIPLGKNLIGLFVSPEHVYFSLNLLDTLPDTVFYSALPEVMKYALIGDAAFFTWLESNKTLIKARDKNAIYYLVDKCVHLKQAVVEKDFKESGVRATLNFGHTFAHAFEQVSHYAISHGEAVGLGMLFACLVSETRAGLSHAVFLSLQSWLMYFDLPIKLPKSVTATEIISAMQHDKKTQLGVIHLVLLSEIGLVCNQHNQYTQPLFEQMCALNPDVYLNTLLDQ